MKNTDSILQMARGAFVERVDYEMHKVIDNILDPNTKATAKRKITLTIELVPDDERQQINVQVTAKSTLAPKTKYSKAAGQDEALMDALRNYGLGSLIRETVNAQSLQGAMSALAEENDDELPEEFEGLVNVYTFNDVTRRKARTFHKQ